MRVLANCPRLSKPEKMQAKLLIFLVFVCATASAQVFKRVGPDGKVYFSDQPGPDARQIEVEPAQTISLPPVTGREEAVTEQDQADPEYTTFAIVSPTSEEELRANDGNITVQLSLQPELKSGHAITLKIDGEDGEAIKSGSGMSVALRNLSRGHHTVEALVVDDAGKVLIQTGAVGFNVLRAAVGGG